MLIAKAEFKTSGASSLCLILAHQTESGSALPYHSLKSSGKNMAVSWQSLVTISSVF